MSTCDRKTFVKVYKNEVENDGDWESVAEKTGLTVSTAKQKISMIRSEQIDLLVKSGKTRDEAKELVKAVLPSFKRGPITREAKTEEIDSLHDMLFGNTDANTDDEVADAEAEVDELETAEAGF